MLSICLKFHTPQPLSKAEIFIAFSPKVLRRTDGIYFFIDVSSTVSVFKGRSHLFEQVLQKAQEIDPLAQASLSETPYGAQALLSFQGNFLLPENSTEKSYLDKLEVSYLLYLEGIFPHLQNQRVLFITDSLKKLGLFNFKQAREHLNLSHWQSRWGKLGESLWKRLQQKEIQEISPLPLETPLREYLFLHEPIGSVEDLILLSQQLLKSLFDRLFTRALFAQKIFVVFTCEYSDLVHRFELAPTSATRDLDIFIRLLKAKVEHADRPSKLQQTDQDFFNCDNPIREIEIQCHAIPEKIEQFSFFDQPKTEDTHWLRLLSLLKQRNFEFGFLDQQPRLLPEQQFLLNQTAQLNAPVVPSRTQFLQVGLNQAVCYQPHYSEMISLTPKPHRVLKHPLALTSRQFRQLRLLTPYATERIDTYWWQNKVRRDYYFASTPDQSLLWIYQDLDSMEYFVHGHFD